VTCWFERIFAGTTSVLTERSLTIPEGAGLLLSGFKKALLLARQATPPPPMVQIVLFHDDLYHNRGQSFDEVSPASRATALKMPPVRLEF
jgi:hypothetical protein